LKPSLEVEALKCLVVNLVAMCIVVSLSGVPPITALLALAFLNHISKNSSFLNGDCFTLLHLFTRELATLCITLFSAFCVFNRIVHVVGAFPGQNMYFLVKIHMGQDFYFFSKRE
jgi:hypothetical protein